jgi:hypothetical protein
LLAEAELEGAQEELELLVLLALCEAELEGMREEVLEITCDELELELGRVPLP